MSAPRPYYMIVWKSLSSNYWNPISSYESGLHPFAATNWSEDLQYVTTICEHLNSLGHRVWVYGLGAYDAAVFRVATVTIADTESLALPKGEEVTA